MCPFPNGLKSQGIKLLKSRFGLMVEVILMLNGFSAEGLKIILFVRLNLSNHLSLSAIITFLFLLVRYKLHYQAQRYC